MAGVDESVDLPTVVAKGGTVYRVGDNTNKEKIYDEQGHQITKSCHICQSQHIHWKCRDGGGCRTSYCVRCAMHCGLKIAQCISDGCPKCQKTCVCLKCLRKDGCSDVLGIALPDRLAFLKQNPLPPSEETDAPCSNSGDGPTDSRSMPRRRAVTNVLDKHKRGRPRKRPATELDRMEQQERPHECQQQQVPRGSFFQAANATLGNELHSGMAVQQPEGATSTIPNAGVNGTIGSHVDDRNGVDDGLERFTTTSQNGTNAEGQGERVYAPGTPLGKLRVVDAEGRQISKACHQCQKQHISFECKTGKKGCDTSYCRRCCDNDYIDLTFDDIMEKCPRCRGICNCHHCLQAPCNPAKHTKYSSEMARHFAEHVLKCTGGQVKDLLNSYDTEVAWDGVKLEDIELEVGVPRRINCGRCFTSIPDLFRSCEECKLDICVDCCQVWRNMFGAVICFSCSKPMKLKKQMKPGMLADLRAVVEKYGNCRVDVNGPSWSRNPSSSDQIAGTNRKDEPKQGHWTERVDKSMVRVCSTHQDADKKYIFCPTASDLENSDEAHQVFQECMRRGDPVIVRNVKGAMDWRAEMIYRAVEQDETGASGAKGGCSSMTVIECSQDEQELRVSSRSFFDEYQSKDAPETMLKVKAWPPQGQFREQLKRHNQDFIEMLPMKQYTSQCSQGALNMWSALPTECLPSDLGPKAHIALGRRDEHPDKGDSVTNLHFNMLDGINVLLDASSHPGEELEQKVRCGDDLWEVPSYGNAGAVWDFVRKEDVARVEEHLRFCNDYLRYGQDMRKCRVWAPMMEETFQLRSNDRKTLEAIDDIHVWHVEQHINEAIYIPAGMPHQVRNLKNCIQVSVDFVPPESVTRISSLAKSLQQLASCDRGVALDKVQGMAMILYAAREAYQITSGKFNLANSESPPEPRDPNKHDQKKRKTNEEPKLEPTNSKMDDAEDQ